MELSKTIKARDRKYKIIDELYNVLLTNETTFAEAQDIIATLKNKLYASAKLQ